MGRIRLCDDNFFLINFCSPNKRKLKTGRVGGIR